MHLADDLQQDAARLGAETCDHTAALMPPLQALRAAVDAVGRAWCGNCVPGVGNLYDRRLQPLASVPAQARVPAALMASCRIWTQHEIGQAVLALAGRPDTAAMQTVAAHAAGSFLQERSKVQGRLHDWLAAHGVSADVGQLLAEVDQLTLADRHSIAARWRSQRAERQPAPPTRTRASPGEATPAHIVELAALQALQSPLDCLARLGELLLRAAQLLGSLPALDARPAADTAGAAALPRRGDDIALEVHGALLPANALWQPHPHAAAARAG